MKKWIASLATLIVVVAMGAVIAPPPAQAADALCNITVGTGTGTTTQFCQPAAFARIGIDFQVQTVHTGRRINEIRVYWRVSPSSYVAIGSGSYWIVNGATRAMTFTNGRNPCYASNGTACVNRAVPNTTRYPVIYYWAGFFCFNLPCTSGARSTMRISFN